MMEELKTKGFTLIELLVVIAIIALLSSVVMASLNTARAKARDTKRIADLTQVRNALEAYYSDHGKYPAGANDSNGGSIYTRLQSLVSGGYISEIPKDPISGKYYYYTGSENTAISGWRCNGIPRSEYEYSLSFTLENNSNAFPKTNVTYATHCILGTHK